VAVACLLIGDEGVESQECDVCAHIRSSVVGLIRAKVAVSVSYSVPRAPNGPTSPPDMQTGSPQILAMPPSPLEWLLGLRMRLNSPDHPPCRCRQAGGLVPEAQCESHHFHFVSLGPTHVPAHLGRLGWVTHLGEVPLYRVCGSGRWHPSANRSAVYSSCWYSPAGAPHTPPSR